MKDKLHEMIEATNRKISKLQLFSTQQEITNLLARPTRTEKENRAVKAFEKTFKKVQELHSKSQTMATHLNELKLAIDKANSNTWLEELLGKSSQRSRIYELSELRRDRVFLERLPKDTGYDDTTKSAMIASIEFSMKKIEINRDRHNRTRVVKLSFDKNQYYDIEE